MMNFQELCGPFGIPIYFLPLPEIIKPVSLRWQVFVGSADDETVGLPGIYHWFEHIPFRGTVRYPNGATDTAGRFSRDGGQVGAHTNPLATVYEAEVPKRRWREALDLITDLFAQPLLTPEGIAAERQVINQEIQDSLANLPDFLEQHLLSHLWGNHPYGRCPLGTKRTLRAMKPDLLREAHVKGYDRSRCVLLVAGNIPPEELLEEVSRCAERIPNRGLSPRRCPATYPPLPAFPRGQTKEMEVSFAHSGALLLFAAPPSHFDPLMLARWTVLTELCSAGIAPLFRIVREERQLAYHTDVVDHLFAEGGCWGFGAGTNRALIPELLQAFRDVLNDSQLRSQDWFEYVLDSMRASMEMRIPDPHELTHEVEGDLLTAGKSISDEEYLRDLGSVRHEEVIALLDSLTPDSAFTFIFRGQEEE